MSKFGTLQIPSRLPAVYDSIRACVLGGGNKADIMIDGSFTCAIQIFLSGWQNQLCWPVFRISQTIPVEAEVALPSQMPPVYVVSCLGEGWRMLLDLLKTNHQRTELFTQATRRAWIAWSSYCRLREKFGRLWVFNTRIWINYALMDWHYAVYFDMFFNVIDVTTCNVVFFGRCSRRQSRVIPTSCYS